MTDTRKRRTLKWLSATPLTVLPFASIAGISSLTEQRNTESPLPVSSKGDLEIQIFDTSSVPDNTVLIHNSGTEKIVISRFMGGSVVFNTRLLDLNTLVAKDPIVVAPGQTRFFTTEIWNVLAAPAIEYVYADHAVDVLNAETSVIRLGVYMLDDKAVIYPNPIKTIYS